MSTFDLVVPAAVVGGCLLLIGLIAWFRRERKPRWSIDAAPDDPDMVTIVDPASLGEWHRAHGSTVMTWISAHETVLRRLSDAELAVDLANPSLFEGTERAGRTLGDAAAVHPSPVMRAELSAMQVAADATLLAVKRADYATAERQHLTYVEYRDEWIRRLRQFSLDDRDLVELRETLTTDQAMSALGPEATLAGDSAADPKTEDHGDDLRLTS